MGRFPELEDRLDDLLRRSERERIARQDALALRRSPASRARATLGPTGEGWLRNVIRPKLAAVARQFPQASAPSGNGRPDHVAVTFTIGREPSGQALIDVKLQLLSGVERIRVFLKMSLLPDPGRCSRRSFLDLPVTVAGLRELNRYLDDGIVAFVGDSLQRPRTAADLRGDAVPDRRATPRTPASPRRRQREAGA